ncbi:MAG TPA: hypothetical protein VK071_08005 [Tissierellales bacterium]|nr:hypothetical protein [Tissierellales bacterium]
MEKIKLQDLIKVLNSNVVKYSSCIEMNFCIDNDPEYEDCWLGKMPDTYSKEVYWFGLIPDGSEAYDYDKLEDLLNAKVFHGKSLCEIINEITWFSLDGCGIEERLPYYLDNF